MVELLINKRHDHLPSIIDLDQVHSSIISASIVAPFYQTTWKVDLISEYLALNE